MKSKMEKKINGKGLIDIIFSWSFEDVINDDLFKAKVPCIPHTFSSVAGYLISFIPAFVEETRAELSSGIACLSSDISLRVVNFAQHSKFEHPTHLLYDAVFLPLSKSAKKDASAGLMYGDVIAFSDINPTKPEHVSSCYVIAVVVSFAGEESDAVTLLTSKVVEFSKTDDLFAVRLGNLTTSMRIWEAVVSAKDAPILTNVIKDDNGAHACAYADSLVPSSLLSRMATWNLNASQETAVMDGIKRSMCFDGYSVNLVWGPPGTGKTTAVACLLLSLLKLQRRTLACAPTNVAVREMAMRLLRHMSGPYGLGDILLFGNHTRLNVEEDSELATVFVDHRVDMLMNITNPCYGYRNRLEEVISMLKSNMEKCEYSDDETTIEEERRKRFLREKLLSSGSRLRFFLLQICTHFPTSFLSDEVSGDMMKAHELLQQIDPLLRARDESGKIESVSKECVETLTRLPALFPFLRNNEFSIKRFCFENSCVLFSTVSGSSKLQDVYTKKNPIHMLVIDEAAQLRECESMIPMRIRGVQHAFLVGDEQQLEAMVQSEVSKKAHLGRSMFERLVKLGYKKHLLNVQYRMHPSISMFPVSEFYSNLISNGANVKMSSYERGFLQGEWCGPYSFINVSCGKEEMELNSYRNMAEVAVIEDIVSRLYKGEMGENLSIGVISPYMAQVNAIERRIEKYSGGGMNVNVRSVDGFQGGEEDIIILSTVRKNAPGNIGFVSNERRTNVAITRARHCLWIIGNGATLSKRRSVWRDIVVDAKSRKCFHEAGDDRGFSLAISLAAIEKGETEEKSRAATLFLKRARWHVKFVLELGEMMRKARERGVLKEAMEQLQSLAYGWRPDEETSKGGSPMVNQCRVGDHTVMLWTVDTARRNSWSVQVMKVWDVLPAKKAKAAAQKIQIFVDGYSARKLKLCKYILPQGDLVVPMQWHTGKTEEFDCLTNDFADLVI